MTKWFFILVLLALCLWPGATPAVSRFPKPEFKSGYVLPRTAVQAPRAEGYAYLDTAVLIGALALVSWCVLRRRFRRELFLLLLFNLLYFGFWRRGCICPVGSVQNVTLALVDRSYTIPAVVLAFFTLPLLFTLFFGRTFCAAVCPLGTMQDAVIVQPARMPLWLEWVLGLGPYLYLALALLLVATGAGFVVCQFDPFVAFFRFGGTAEMLIAGVLLLVLGMVVARPYCRFLCPYGALLAWASRLAQWHATITPAECIHCRLCENACPFGAIRRPTPAHAPESRAAGVRRLGLLILLLPLLMLGGGWIGSLLHVPLSRLHSTVALSEQVRREDTGRTHTTTQASRTFRASGRDTAELFAEATDIQRRFRTGGWLAGAFLGLVFGARLIGLTLRRPQKDYTPDPGLCLSCGRCFEYCPIEHARRRASSPISQEKAFRKA